MDAVDPTDAIDAPAIVLTEFDVETDAKADVADCSTSPFIGEAPAPQTGLLLDESKMESAFDMLADVADQRSLVENAVLLELARSRAC